MSSTSTTLVPSVVRPHGLVTEVALVVVGVALIAASAQIAIPLPFTPVPITGQTFAALLVGASYGSGRGLLTFGGYLLLGGLGAPVFADHHSGWSVLSLPTGGYLVGMLVAVGLVGRLAERGWDRRLLTSVVAMVAGNLVIYAFGLVWLGHALGTDAARTWALGAQPFLAGDAVKIALAAGLLPLAWKGLDAIRS